MQAIRLFYIDDHHVTRSGLRTIFRSSRDFVCVAGEAKSVEEALTLAGNISFDIFLLDLWLQSGDPLKNYQQLNAAFPNHPIVIYTGEKSAYWQRKMYHAGAYGYIDKEAEKTEIRLILEDVMLGNRSFPKYKPGNDTKNILNSHGNSRFELTEAEQHIITLLINGDPSNIIADKLHIHASTVDKSLRRIRKKMQVSSNIEMVKIFLMMDSV